MTKMSETQRTGIDMDAIYDEAWAEHAARGHVDNRGEIGAARTQRYHALVKMVRGFAAARDVLHAEALLEDYGRRPHMVRAREIGEAEQARATGTACFHPRSCRECDALDKACGAHRKGDPGHESCSGTPAERITGISDRAAAALVDVAALRALISAASAPDGEAYAARNRAMAQLDRIEAALRERQS